MKYLTLLSLSMLLLMFACKEEDNTINQDSIFTIYELSYDVDNDITTAKATFRKGSAAGPLIELVTNTVTFDGEILVYNTLLGAHVKEFTGFKTSGTFVYTDLDENVFTNTTPTIHTVDFPAVDTISNAAAFTFAWQGDAVKANETMYLTMDGTAQNNFEIFSTSAVGATDMNLSAEKLQNLGLGDATCTIKRAYNKYSVDQGTSTGGRMSVWYTVSKNINITN